MNSEVFSIAENVALTESVWKMVLEGNTSEITAPGQFVEVQLPALYLRRPISVCDCTDGRLTLVYKIVGTGTDVMSKLSAGTRLNVLTGLGNGYDLTRSGDCPLLIGGGVGVPPLYWLCKKLCAEGKHPSVILGFNTAAEIFYEEEFKALGVPVTVTTVDGSKGVPGFVTDAMDCPYTHFYSCGPLPMLRAIDKVAKTDGDFSMEERMGCGFGACMGCSIPTKNGPKRVCKDGPVFKRDEVIL